MTSTEWVFLSHFMDRDIPVYGDTAARPTITPVKSIRQGDSANVFRFTLENHWGTHVDTPAHFFDQGPNLVAFEAADWVFDHPCCLGLSVEADDMIQVDLFEAVPESCDLLLLKTGFQRYRGQELYSHHNPGIHAEAGVWLRQNRPNLRALGMDFVSLSPRSDRQAGRQSHRTFLDPDAAGRPLRLIEDMDLDHDLSRLVQVIVSPLFFSTMDSAPCTVFGALKTG